MLPQSTVGSNPTPSTDFRTVGVSRTPASPVRNRELCPLSYDGKGRLPPPFSDEESWSGRAAGPDRTDYLSLTERVLILMSFYGVVSSG